MFQLCSQSLTFSRMAQGETPLGQFFVFETCFVVQGSGFDGGLWVKVYNDRKVYIHIEYTHIGTHSFVYVSGHCIPQTWSIIILQYLNCLNVRVFGSSLLCIVVLLQYESSSQLFAAPQWPGAWAHSPAVLVEWSIAS